MFRISAITRVGLVAVACVAVAAPSALAKPPVTGKAKSLYGYAMSYTPTKATRKAAKPAKVQSVNAYTQGCQNGTVSDRTMGGDNNNYEYYGDVCTVSVPTSPELALGATSDQTAATPSAGPAVAENTDYECYWDYEYYGRC